MAFSAITGAPVNLRALGLRIESLTRACGLCPASDGGQDDDSWCARAAAGIKHAVFLVRGDSCVAVIVKPGDYMQAGRLVGAPRRSPVFV